jgi:NADH-quinone oxidoreductase subunit M
VVTVAALLATQAREVRRPRLFVGLLLATATGSAGVLMAQDLVLFYVFWEAVLVPLFALIAIYGEGQKTQAALKLLIYTGGASVAMLVAILAVYSAHPGAPTFAIDQLTRSNLGGGKLVLGLSRADLAFIGLAFAFAVKTPLFPFHGWMADAYTASPTPVVMVLAGVVSKLGPYGFFRVASPLLPPSAQRFTPLLMTLAAVGIVYGALLALRQEDVKRMVAYLSLSHMCFITLGITSLTPAGMSGAVVQMVNHGILIAALFFIVGHFERRLGTRRITEIVGLARGAPRLAAVFLLLALATLGLPGLNGFVGEYLVMLGAYSRSWALLLLAAAGVVLAAWYTLRLYQRTMNGPSAEVDGAVAELHSVELSVLLPLAALAVAIGVFPAPLLSAVNISVNSLVAILVTG